MTNTLPTTEAAARLAERLRSQTVESLKDSHSEAYHVGVNAAADTLDADALSKLNDFFVESLEGVAVHTLSEDDVWNGLVAAVGDADTARDLLAETAGAPLDSPSELAAFVLGAVETWREAKSLL
jgi:hypothetical protein